MFGSIIEQTSYDDEIAMLLLMNLNSFTSFNIGSYKMMNTGFDLMQIRDFRNHR